MIIGIKNYSKTDFEVYQFGKILRGQVSEFHRFSSFALKENIAICLKQALDEKYHPQHKTESWIQNFKQKIISGLLGLDSYLYRKMLQKLAHSTSNLP